MGIVKTARATGLERLELQQLRDRVGRLFAALQEATEAENPLASGSFAPPVDLCETSDAIWIRVELPGVNASNIKIGVTSTQIKIWGEKKRRAARRRIISYVCSERSYGKFSRIIHLRWSISVRQATAEIANGILLISLPKIEDRRGAEFKIEVRDANPEIVQASETLVRKSE
jgi:HSP20 family protein